MKKRTGYFYLIATAIAACGLVSVSCDKSDPDNGFGPNAKTKGIKLNVTQTSEFVETKAGNIAKLSNVFGSEDDGLVIEEYVSDMDGNIPETKGTIITGYANNTGNISSIYGAFNVMAFLDTLDKDKNAVHVNEFNLTSKYVGSEWTWYKGSSAASGKDIPKWRTSTATTMWSYAPASLALTEDNVTDGTQGWADGEYGKLTFSHTVPVGLADQQDLIFAYNNEKRDFRKDAKGDYIKDANGDLQFVAGQDENVDIKFCHALAAVKFVLNSTTAGANVHSITLCCTDPVTKNISMTNGIYTSGDCTVTGSNLGAPDATNGTGGLSWSNLGGQKPLHYVFPDTYPADGSTVAGGFTSTGQGVMFMIPQNLSTLSNLKIIIEFSKFGGSSYYTKVVDMPATAWVAGKYYTYKLTIGEFHVPGEKMNQLTDVVIDGLKNNSSDVNVFVRPMTDGKTPKPAPIPIKGVTKMGLALDGYGLGAKVKDNQTVYMYCNKYGSENSLSAPGPGFQFNFSPVSAVAGSAELFTFGTDNTAETYYNCYSFERTQDQNKHPASNGVASYYVFDTAGETEFLLYFKPSAGDNSGGFFGDIKGLMVLEVAEDPNLPGNFSTINWE